MSELVHTGKGGEFATSRRGGIAADVEFILAQKARGVPTSAIARMVGRAVPDVRLIVEGVPAKPCERAAVAAPLTGNERRRERWHAKRPKKDPREGLSAPMPQGAAKLVRLICEHYGVRLDELIGDTRRQQIVRIRQEAFTALYDTRRYSLPQIGRWFGRRDHTTVMHGIREHRKRQAEAEMAVAA